MEMTVSIYTSLNHRDLLIWRLIGRQREMKMPPPPPFFFYSLAHVFWNSTLGVALQIQSCCCYKSKEVSSLCRNSPERVTELCSCIQKQNQKHSIQQHFTQWDVAQQFIQVHCLAYAYWFFHTKMVGMQRFVEVIITSRPYIRWR